jgi:hypothetical protein
VSAIAGDLAANPLVIASTILLLALVARPGEETTAACEGGEESVTRRQRKTSTATVAVRSIVVVVLPMIILCSDSTGRWTVGSPALGVAVRRGGSFVARSKRSDSRTLSVGVRKRAVRSS